MIPRSLAACCLLASIASSAWAFDTVVTARQTRDYDERADHGYCDIRVWVDDEVNIFLQANRVTFETVRGQEARDGGTECSQPLPRGLTMTDFQFKGIDGRGKVALIEEPGPRNGYRAWVRIQDPRSGGDEHRFRLSWRNVWTNQELERGGAGRFGRDDFPGRGRGRDRFDGVCFYEQTQFGGKEYCVGVGEHVANVGPEWNDKFESMRLFGRAREVEMFDDQNYAGGNYRTTRDEPDLGRLRDSRGQPMARRITSFRVY